MSSCPDSHYVPNMKSQMSPTVDSEREELRKYLEAGGLLDVLTGIFKEMYGMKERPADPLSYFTSTLNAVNYESFEVAAQEDEIRELKSVIENLESENAALRSKLDVLSSSYILVEILTDQFKNRLRLPLLEKDLRRAILQSVELLHGDYGLACIQCGFAIKMYNPATRVFILRVRRRYHSLVCSSLPFISTFASSSSAKTLRGCLRTLRLTGTIRCAFKFLIQHDKEKLAEMVKVFRDVPEVEKKLTEIIGKCHKRVAKRRLDVP